MKKMEEEKGGEGVGRGRDREMEEKVRVMEIRIERKEREDRKRNIVIRGLKIERGNARQEIEGIMKEIGVEVKMEKIKQVRTGKEEWGDMVVVKLGGEEEKRKVMEGKKKLRGGKIWIMEDLTWKERKMRWRLREIAREEERKGSKVWVGNDRITINGEWWFWDEEGEILRDRRGRERSMEVEQKAMRGEEEERAKV